MTSFGLAYVKREGYPDLNHIEMYYKGGIEGFINDLWDLIKKMQPLMGTDDVSVSDWDEVQKTLRELGL